MTSANPGRLVGRGLGPLLALAACVGSLPAMARAGCADGHGSRPGIAHFEGLGSAGALALATESSPSDLPGRPAPCPGGICTRGPANPAAPAATVAGHVTHWALPARPIPPPRAESSARTRDAEDRGPLHEGPSLFRPPRRA